MVIVTTTLTVSTRTAEHQEMRVYFFHEGEDLVHNLAWRRDRPIQWYFEWLPAILRDVGIGVTESEAQEPLSLGSWQQQAGCECGCSPGIVLSRPAPFDLYVTIASRVEVSQAARVATTAADDPPRDVKG
jgi:hypothetical protein